jgi:hypothetical protein
MTATIGVIVAPVLSPGAGVRTASPPSERLSSATPVTSVTLTAASTAATGTHQSAGSVPITLTVPVGGAFTVTITLGAVPLTVSGSMAMGILPDVTVTDTRNYYPGWYVTGQEADFTTAGGRAISGNQLGWAPAVVGSLHDGAVLGGAVAPGHPGLGTTPATLAAAAPGNGFGTNKLSAILTLVIPAQASGRRDLGVLTLTYVEAGWAATTRPLSTA